MFRGSVRGYWLPTSFAIFPFTSPPRCFSVCHHISTGLYTNQYWRFLKHRRCCLQAAPPVHYTTSCKHSLVLLRMGEIIGRNMLSWLKLSIKSVNIASSWLFTLLYQWCTVTQTSYFLSYLSQFFLEWEMFQTEAAEQIITRFCVFMFSNASFSFIRSCLSLDNVEEFSIADQATDDNMAHAHSMLDTHGYIYSQYVILISFPLHQRLREHASVRITLYVHRLYCM